MRFRRARSLIIHWKRGKLIIENYRTRVSVSASPVTIGILHFLDSWRSPEYAFRRLPEYSRASVRAAVGQLARQTLLVKEGSREAREDARLEKVWSAWLPYGSFHFGTKDVKYVRGWRREQLHKSYFADSPQPAFSKSYRHAPRRALPPGLPASGEFPRVLLSRKTHRQFSRASVPLSAVSRLLFLTWGVMGHLPSSFGRLFHKTSPSGGARHPGEVYLVALRVEGLSPGLYHYNARSHILELLRKGQMRDLAFHYCGGQPHARQAAALFLMTAVFRRTMWKYRFARVYRAVLLETGHLCQTFCLTATWLGLAPFCTAALNDSMIERDLGVDGITESVLYVAGVGMPRQQDGP